MADPLLDICDDPPGIGLVPTPVKLLGREAELDDQVAGQVFRPFLSSGFRAGHIVLVDFAPFLTPEPHQCRLVSPHNDPGV
jgi:hypothetical protein